MNLPSCGRDRHTQKGKEIMPFIRFLLIVIVFVFPGGSEAATKASNELRKIKHAVGELGNTDNAKRNAAAKTLIKSGKSAIPLLKDTIRLSSDLEIVLRSKNIIMRIERNLVLKRFRIAYRTKTGIVILNSGVPKVLQPLKCKLFSLSKTNPILYWTEEDEVYQQKLNTNSKRELLVKSESSELKPSPGNRYIFLGTEAGLIMDATNNRMVQLPKYGGPICWLGTNRVGYKTDKENSISIFNLKTKKVKFLRPNDLKIYGTSSYSERHKLLAFTSTRQTKDNQGSITSYYGLSYFNLKTSKQHIIERNSLTYTWDPKPWSAEGNQVAFIKNHRVVVFNIHTERQREFDIKNVMLIVGWIGSNKLLILQEEYSDYSEFIRFGHGKIKRFSTLCYFDLETNATVRLTEPGQIISHRVSFVEIED